MQMTEDVKTCSEKGSGAELAELFKEDVKVSLIIIESSIETLSVDLYVRKSQLLHEWDRGRYSEQIYPVARFIFGLESSCESKFQKNV